MHGVICFVSSVLHRTRKLMCIALKPTEMGEDNLLNFYLHSAMLVQVLDTALCLCLSQVSVLLNGLDGSS